MFVVAVGAIAVADIRTASTSTRGRGRSSIGISMCSISIIISSRSSSRSRSRIVAEVALRLRLRLRLRPRSIVRTTLVGMSKFRRRCGCRPCGLALCTRNLRERTRRAGSGRSAGSTAVATLIATGAVSFLLAVACSWRSKHTRRGTGRFWTLAPQGAPSSLQRQC